MVDIYNIRGAISDNEKVAISTTVRCYLTSDGTLVQSATTLPDTGEFVFSNLTQGTKYTITNHGGDQVLAKSSQITGQVKLLQNTDLNVNRVRAYLVSTGALISSAYINNDGEFTLTGLTTDVEYAVVAFFSEGIVPEAQEGSEQLAIGGGNLLVAPGVRLFVSDN